MDYSSLKTINIFGLIDDLTFFNVENLKKLNYKRFSSCN